MADMFRGSDGTLLALTVDRGPDGSPTFLFVNGLACPSFYWDSMRAAFRGRATLVSFDLKGHGESNAASTSAFATMGASGSHRRALRDRRERAPVEPTLARCRNSVVRDATNASTIYVQNTRLYPARLRNDNGKETAH